MKRQRTVWVKLFPNDISDEGGNILKIYKELIQLNIKKNQILKWLHIYQTWLDIFPKMIYR